MTPDSAWKQVLHTLRREFPKLSKVSVRRVRRLKSGYFGECCKLDSGKFSVVVAREYKSAVTGWRPVTHEEMLDVLRHELAHALAWVDEPEGDHGPKWGAAYAAVYTATEPE